MSKVSEVIYQLERADLPENLQNKRWKFLLREARSRPGVLVKRCPVDEPPEWFDAKRFANAQELARQYFLSFQISHFVGNLFLTLYPPVTITVLSTGRSTSSQALLSRIIGTIRNVDTWYHFDPFEKNNDAHRSFRITHQMHCKVSQLMMEKYPLEERVWISQYDMMITQWCFIGPLIMKAKQCGLYKQTRKLLEEYIYLWRVLGHCLGINDDFNCCLDDYEKTVQLMEAIFNYEFKICIEDAFSQDPTEIAKHCRMLLEGVFHGINTAAPKLIISYESFMNYWFASFKIEHRLKIDSWSLKASEMVQSLFYGELLGWSLMYRIFSRFYFLLRTKLMNQRNQSKNKTKNIQFKILSSEAVLKTMNEKY